MINFHALPVFSRPCVTYFPYPTVLTGNYGKTGSTVLFPVPSPHLLLAPRGGSMQLGADTACVLYIIEQTLAVRRFFTNRLF